MNTNKRKLALLLVVVAVLGFGIGVLLQTGCNQQTQQAGTQKEETLYQSITNWENPLQLYCLPSILRKGPQYWRAIRNIRGSHGEDR